MTTSSDSSDAMSGDPPVNDGYRITASRVVAGFDAAVGNGDIVHAPTDLIEGVNLMRACRGCGHYRFAHAYDFTSPLAQLEPCDVRRCGCQTFMFGEPADAE